MLTSSGTSLGVQWLGLHASTAGGTGSIPGRGTEILQAMLYGEKKRMLMSRKKGILP